MAGERILVVDEEPNIRILLQEQLEPEEYQVTLVASGEEALSRSATQVPDLAIVDLMLPDMDGMEVARRIKEVASQTPVIMLTGWGQQLSPTAERTPHVDILLSKPPQLTDLRAALEAVSSSGRRKGDSPA